MWSWFQAALLTINSGQTIVVVPNASYNTAQGIIIKNGGTLEFQGGDITIDAGNEIVIEAGGQMIGQGGSIKPIPHNGPWSRIFVESIGTDGVNAPPAIDITGLDIEGSVDGITTWYSGDPIPRIIMTDVTMGQDGNGL